MSQSYGPISSQQAGANAEAGVIDTRPQFVHLPDHDVQHADARVDELVEATPELPIVGMCLLEVGTLVEIKSSMVRLANGKRGKFYLREGQHQKLLNDGAVYLFAVCEPNPDRDILALKAVPATRVDALIDGKWRDAGDGRPRCYQLSWGRVFHHDEVNGGTIE
jgi:hypothetical protein